jgi:D-amino peptidase
VRVYVKADMEGISGVVSPTQLVPGSPEHENARRLLMHDLNAVLEGAFSAGCTEVVIYDAHGAGLNVDVGELDRRAVVVSGRPQFTDGFFCGLDGSFEALFLVGYHARAGAADALLPRSYDDDIASMCVNTTELGEIGLEAALAGKFGVPLAFVSGDSGAVREAKELLGEELETVEVKQAITSTSAVCLPAAQTHRLLRDAAARAVRKARHMPTVVFQSPTVLEVTFRTRGSADALESSSAVERTGECSVRTRGSSILAAYRDFVQARSLNGHA